MRGPISSFYSRTSTGVVGISIVRTTKKHRSHLRTYFSVHTRKPNGKPRNRHFCINTLGREEAWRRAVKFRATHELKAGGARLSRAVES